MQVGVHLPQCAFDRRVIDPARLRAYVITARDLGFAAIAANDHFAFSRPWLDGPTLLAAVAEHAGELDLATTIALPSLRGPVPLVTSLATLQALAAGRVLAGIGPGSSRVDYELTGVPYDERWSRFDAAAVAMRALLDEQRAPEIGPEPVTTEPIPLWVASWGSLAGLRRVARLGDGWLASAFHASVDDFAVARRRLDDLLAEQDRPRLPSAAATMWTYVTDDDTEADRVLHELLAPTLGRSPEQLRPRVCVGPPDRCAELLSEYRDSGCDRIYLWPVAEEAEQLHRIADEVVPQLAG